MAGQPTVTRGSHSAAGRILASIIGALLAGTICPVAIADDGHDLPFANWVKTSTGLPTTGVYYGVYFAKLDNDAYLDIIAASYGSGLRVYKGDGTGNWTAWTALATTGGYSDVCAGDYDNDGKMDFFAGSPGESGTPTGLHVYKGDALGGFTEATSGSGLPTLNYWRGIAVGDANKDGKLDLAATSGWGSSRGVHVFTGNGAGLFADNSTGLPSSQDTGSGTVLADLNGDSNLDTYGGWDNAEAYLGNGGGGGAMSWTPSKTGLPTGGHYTGVDVADFDKDGSVDLLISSYSGNGLRAYRNVNNAASWSSMSSGLPTSGGYMDVVARDLNGDGNIDLATAGYSGVTGIHVFHGDGFGNWVESSSGLPASNTYVGGHAGDIDNDGRFDLIFGRFNNGGVEVWRNIGAIVPEEIAFAFGLIVVIVMVATIPTTRRPRIR